MINKQLLKCLLVAVGGGVFFTQASSAATSSFTPEQTKQIQTIVHDYLVQQPEVLIEASRSLQEKEATKAEQTAMSAIAKNKQKLFHDPASPVIGNPDGDVTIVEFFDYQCGHCKTMMPVIGDLIKDNSGLKVVLKDWPIFGENSSYAAKASLAVAKKDQAKYLAFHNALFGSEDALTQDKVKELANGVGVNFDALSPTIDVLYTQQQLTDNGQLADALKLVGTPAFIIANKSLTQFRFVPGATSKQQLQQLIDEVKSGAPAPKS